MTRLAWLVVWLMAACGGLDAQAALVIQPFTPPAWYREAFRAAERCSGLRPKPGHDFDHVQWFTFPHDALRSADGTKQTFAMWTPGDRIIVDSGYTDVPWVIVHELMHQLLQGGRGGDAHPDIPFRMCRLMYDQQPWAEQPYPDPLHPL